MAKPSFVFIVPPIIASRGTMCNLKFCCEASNTLVLGDFWQAVETLLQVGIGGDGIAHLSVEVVLIGGHIKVPGTGEAEKDGLGLAALPAPQSLVDGPPDSVGGFRGGENGFPLGKEHRRLKNAGLLIGHRLHIAVVVESFEKVMQLPAEKPALEEIRRVVTIFRELRQGATADGKTKLKTPSGTLSTAEAISVVNNGLAMAGYFGDGEIHAEDLVSGILGAVVKDPVQDKVVWQEYMETVVKNRDGWKDIYRASRDMI